MEKYEKIFENQKKPTNLIPQNFQKQIWLHWIMLTFIWLRHSPKTTVITVWKTAICKRPFAIGAFANGAFWNTPFSMFWILEVRFNLFMTKLLIYCVENAFNPTCEVESGVFQNAPFANASFANGCLPNGDYSCLLA